jgi:uridine phosphorylase
MAMERLIALGATRLWVLGWCGSLQGDLRIGDLVVPTEAVSEEGTSRHYPIAGDRPRSAAVLNSVIERSLREQGLKYRMGGVWTTDAPYRETPSKVLAYGRMGVLAVEMEMAALMTVALFRGISLGGLLVVSDELFDLIWRPGFSGEALKTASSKAVETLLCAVGDWAREPSGPEHPRP